MEERQIQQEDEINLFDYLIVLLKRKRLIIGITLGAAIITAIISLIMPPIYRAETKILPPQQGSSMATQFLSQLGSAAGLVGGAVGGAVGIKTPNDLYIGLLKSRLVLDGVIDRFKLMELYKTKSRENARRGLADTLKARDDKKSGIITIGVEDKDPKRAADMANAFVEELKNMNKGLAVTEAGQRRLFFEEQLKDTKEALIKAEDSMEGFQERTGAIKIDEQAKAVIEGIANLRAQIAAKEVGLKVMRTYATPQNPDIQRAEEELRGMREQLGRLETRSGGHNPDPLMPTGRIPALGTEYIRKLREFKYQEALYEILLKQYEAARLDEARDAAIIQVIEKAIPPEKRVKPKRKQMVMIATFSGLFFSVFAAFFMEYIEKLKSNPEDKVRLEAIKKNANFRLKG
ncbi:MAG: chain length determinant family protein [Nitrospirae bacterium CG_4_10_14_0_8_um_filter_41_23]|nr:MAG: chain length determinant family protein [Nitrospirae bacterium CG_4_10_14_0_8_um_filter_41_23]